MQSEEKVLGLPAICPAMMIHTEHYEAAVSLRRESSHLREKWLSYKSVDPKFFREMANQEMKRYRALDWCIKWHEGIPMVYTDDQVEYINRALSEIDFQQLKDTSAYAATDS
jgi:hypothetical protein